YPVIREFAARLKALEPVEQGWGGSSSATPRLPPGRRMVAPEVSANSTKDRETLLQVKAKARPIASNTAPQFVAATAEGAPSGGSRLLRGSEMNEGRLPPATQKSEMS